MKIQRRGFYSFDFAFDWTTAATAIEIEIADDDGGKEGCR